MNYGIFTAKLLEVDEKIGKIHSRISYGETADFAQLDIEIENLRRECLETEVALENELRGSRFQSTGKLAENYRKIEQIIRASKQDLLGLSSDAKVSVLSVEEKILFAEYALDFAVQAVNRALLISMEAIREQKLQEEQEGEDL